jgi:hypothetical protein
MDLLVCSIADMIKGGEKMSVYREIIGVQHSRILWSLNVI